MEQVILPWGLYVGAMACAFIYVQLLPEVFVRRRLGVSGGLDGSLWWLCVLAILALMAWPFFAAVTIEWKRDPSLLTILLMALGAAAAGFCVQLVVQMIVGAYVGALVTSDDSVALLTFGKLFSAVTTLALLGFTAAAYGALHGEVQNCLASRYC